MTTFSEVNSQLKSSNTTTSSLYTAQQKEFQRLSELCNQYYGQVTDRSHDLGQLQTKLDASQKKLEQMDSILRDLSLALDLDAKISQRDELKVSFAV